MPDLKVDVSLLRQTFPKLDECASALGATDATVDHLVDGIGHPRLQATMTAFAENPSARRTRPGLETRTPGLRGQGHGT